MAIRVLIVDDSAFMRNMLKRMVTSSDEFEVVGLAENGLDGVQKTLELKPDVVTMDVEMPVMTGLDALERIMAQCPTPVIMVSTLTEQGARITLDALDKGAIDFLPKSLQDADKNVFKSAGILHEKLRAASKVKMRAAVTDVKPMPAFVAATGGGQKLVGKRVMVVGSSTGGPRALQAVISELSAKFPVPVIIAQHMPGEFTKALASRLNETCDIRVELAQHGQEIKKGTVYIAPGGFHTRVLQSNNGSYIISVKENMGESVYKPSVEVLGQSALDAYAGDVLAVMLTGMGGDGAESFKKLKDAGGHIVVQDEATCTVYGMPRAVVEAGGATEVFPLPHIAKRLNELML